MKVVRELLVMAFRNLTMKTLVGLVVVIGIVSILATLIVNPEALHPDKNPNISIIIGIWFQSFTGLFHYYYKKPGETGKEGEK